MTSRLLFKMITREVTLPFFFTLGAMSLLFLTGKLFAFIEPLLAAGITFKEFLWLNLLMLPIFLYILIPICTLLAVLIAFLRFSRDSEIIALFSCGIGPKRLLAPVAILSLLSFLVALYVSAIIVPKAKFHTRHFMKDITERVLLRGLPEKRFFSPIKGLTFFVDKSRANGRRFQGVFISDSRKKEAGYTILAKRGELSADKRTGKVALKLFDGHLLRKDQGLDVFDSIRFKKYILTLSTERDTKWRRKGEMTTAELFSRAKDKNVPEGKRNDYLIEFHKRIGIPFSSLIMGLLAAPLGIFFGRSGVSVGICAGLSAFLAYYLSIILGTTLADEMILTPGLGVWLPNALFSLLTFFVIRRLERRGPLLD